MMTSSQLSQMEAESKKNLHNPKNGCSLRSTNITLTKKNTYQEAIITEN